MLTELWPFYTYFGLNCGFWSVTFEVMQQFHSKFTEGKGIIKHRSISNLEVIRKIVTDLIQGSHKL